MSELNKNASMCHSKELLFSTLNSYDGVPFLMHDLTLARTTNVKKVLPEKVQKKADGFTWEFLQHLNAGEWFIKVGGVQNLKRGISGANPPPEGFLRCRAVAYFA